MSEQHERRRRTGERVGQADRGLLATIVRSGVATAFHRSDSATLPHIASFISIGCSALAPNRPCRYSSTAWTLLISSSLKP